MGAETGHTELLREKVWRVISQGSMGDEADWPAEGERVLSVMSSVE